MNKYLLLLWVSVLLILPQASYADTIRLMADPWCPYNCEPGSENPGYMVEVAKEVFAKHGHDVQYKRVNWSRAIHKGRTGDLEGIIGSSRGDAPDYVYPEMNLGYLESVYITLKTNDRIYIEDTNSLKGSIIGAIQDYHYGDNIESYIRSRNNIRGVQLISGYDALERLYNMLVKGRIDLFIENKFVALDMAKKMGISDKIKIVHYEKNYKTDENATYIAFSPVNPKSEEYAKILSDGIKELRKSGRLSEILTKYGISDWE